MDAVGILIGSAMLLALFASWWHIVLLVFASKQDVVMEDTIETSPVLDENMEDTGKEEEVVVSVYTIDAHEAEAINYGAAVLLVAKVFAFGVAMAGWYFIFQPLFM